MLSNYVEVALLVRYTEWLLKFVFFGTPYLYLPSERLAVNTRGIYDAVFAYIAEI
jgi:hypothetical protein